MDRAHREKRKEARVSPQSLPAFLQKIVVMSGQDEVVVTITDYSFSGLGFLTHQPLFHFPLDSLLPLYLQTQDQVIYGRIVNVSEGPEGLTRVGLELVS